MLVCSMMTTKRIATTKERRDPSPWSRNLRACRFDIHSARHMQSTRRPSCGCCGHIVQRLTNALETCTYGPSMCFLVYCDVTGSERRGGRQLRARTRSPRRRWSRDLRNDRARQGPGRASEVQDRNDGGGFRVRKAHATGSRDLRPTSEPPEHHRPTMISVPIVDDDTLVRNRSSH